MYFNLLFCFSFSIGTAGSKTVNEVTTSSDVIDENPSESMSQISGFRRTLSQANSVSGPDHAPVPKFGVATDKESELAEVIMHNQPIFSLKSHSEIYNNMSGERL